MRNLHAVFHGGREVSQILSEPAVSAHRHDVTTPVRLLILVRGLRRVLKQGFALLTGKR